jgi:undecaprenyl pyrophosphate phosphatase UppP
MKTLENFSSWPFAVYRLLLGIVILASVAMGWLT